MKQLRGVECTRSAIDIPTRSAIDIPNGGFVLEDTFFEEPT